MYPTTFSYMLTPLPHTYIFHSCLTTTSYGFQVLFHALQHMECQRVGDNALWLITMVTAVQRETTGGNGRQRANSKETATTRRNTTGGAYKCKITPPHASRKYVPQCARSSYFTMQITAHQSKAKQSKRQGKSKQLKAKQSKARQGKAKQSKQASERASQPSSKQSKQSRQTR